MAKVVMTEDGTKTYFNGTGHRHREDGPAVIFRSGGKLWIRDGFYYCDNGPHAFYAHGVWVCKYTDDGSVWRSPNGHNVYYVTGEAIWPTLL